MNDQRGKNAKSRAPLKRIGKGIKDKLLERIRAKG
jgi:hypothetical protein